MKALRKDKVSKSMQNEAPRSIENNDPTGYDDDTIGENTELTPIANAVLRDRERSQKKS